MEPEGLLIDGARRATVTARELWWRARPPRPRRELPLARVKRRLELVVGALYGDTPSILPSDPPPFQAKPNRPSHSNRLKPL